MECWSDGGGSYISFYYLLLMLASQGIKLGSCLLHPTSFVLYNAFLFYTIVALAVRWTVEARVVGV